MLATPREAVDRGPVSSDRFAYGRGHTSTNGIIAARPVLYASSVVQATEKIEALLRHLEKTGADPRRLDALRCAQRFKRSWVELAETLVEVRTTESFAEWGYDDFYEYCTQELHLRRATVDKLTISFSTLKRLAPSVLKRDGISKEIPSLQAVEYFGKAVDAANDGRAKDSARDVIKDLRHAVFDEGQAVTELRRRFDPILRPKPKAQAQLDRIQRAIVATRKLIDELPEIDGLSQKHLSKVEQALGVLRQELEELAEPLREKIVARKQAKSKSRGQTAAEPS
jgi:hypothetical protein